MSLITILAWLTAFAVGLCCAGALFSLAVWRAVFPAANRQRRKKLLAELDIQQDDKLLVGFFHPYCNAGGGGERVLWAAVACLQREEPKTVCLIYTGDVDASKEEIVAKVQARFSINLDPARLHFVYLQQRYLVEDGTWKHFTLLGQSLGSIVLGYEAIHKISPDVFIDTMGYAFIFPLVKLLSPIPVGAYVHYPTISTNMLQRVKDRSAGHTNTAAVSRSALLSNGKLIYYMLFARLYRFCLKKADHIMVNSSWTQAHINSILGREPRQGKAAKIVYPPCDTNSLSHLPLEGRHNEILSLAQFRPEKDHNLQLRSFKLWYDSATPGQQGSWTLLLAGSVRNAGDEARVEQLKSLAAELGISHRVTFVINAPFTELLRLFGGASIGLSTMTDEHFGINVVELMAAGLIPVVHASGGPLLDIVTPFEGKRTGFHATDPAAFAKAIDEIVNMPEHAQLSTRRRIREAAETRFNERVFDDGWMTAWRALCAQVPSAH